LYLENIIYESACFRKVINKNNQVIIAKATKIISLLKLRFGIKVAARQNNPDNSHNINTELLLEYPDRVKR
jgi:hypothetical protein